ncbi:hypothetical protein vseg_017032 [Gypsophila vaccaria]
MMNPRNVDEVIMDYKGRRGALVKALTKDVEIFYNLCDPKHSSLCLYGLPSQWWEVNSPSSPSLQPPLGIPEPRSGINLVRDDMPKDEWVSMVALYSDAWLHGVASYFSVKYKFDKADRKRLFNEISNLSLISELITGGTTRKRGKVENRGLPDEMVVEVLARLPVKDLCKYRLVCIKWRSFIDDPSFVRAHLESYKSNIVGNQLFVGMERARSWGNSERVIVRHSDTFRQLMTLKNLNVSGKYNVLGYVNGLILVKRSTYESYKTILWNPSINKSQNVPDTMVHPTEQPSYYEFGLGFDASINDYKVVCFTFSSYSFTYYFRVNRYHVPKPGLVQVYSLRTNSWTTKNGAHPPLNWAVGPQIYVNGAVHWMGFGPSVVGDSSASNKPCSHIVSFDFGDEVFKYLELPVDVIESGYRDTSVTVMDGCLSIFCVHDCLHDIWVMNENGNSNSWSRCYTFNLSYDKGLYFKGNGEFLYAVDGVGINAYDVKKKCVRYLARTYCKTSTYTVFTHVESLVLSTSSRVDN